MRRWTVLAAVLPLSAYAAHPLTTDDTGTQGRGRFQLELIAERASDLTEAGRERSTAVNAVLSYGVHDAIDVVLDLPWQNVQAEGVERVRGRGDAGTALKWRFYEADKISVAFKPGVRFATGDESRGLGAGRSGYSAFLVATYNPAPWAVHAQLGSVRNRNVLDERERIYHASMGGWYAFRDWRAVLDLGRSTNTDEADARSVEFATVGLIYGVTPDLDLDVGYKKALSVTETDRAVLVGITWRF
jgi:hypothetical protein